MINGQPQPIYTTPLTLDPSSTVTPMPSIAPSAPVWATPPGAQTLGPAPTLPTTPPATLPNPGGSQFSTYGLDGGRQVTPNELVANQLNSLLGSGSQYIDNARRRGAEYANSRGLMNSSIGAGASQRAAIEAGLPIAQSDAGAYRSANDQTYGSYDNLRNQYTQAQLGRTNSLFEAQTADWLQDRNFTRQFNGTLAMLPIQNAADMWAGLMNLAAEDPTVFTPTVLAGYQDFFQSGFDEYIGRYLAAPTTPAAGG